MENTKLTNEQIETVLIKNNWTKVTGWVMDYEKDEHNNVIVTTDDFERFKVEKPKDWFWHEGYDYVYDLEDAFCNFYDDYCDEKDLDISDTEFDELLIKEYFAN